MTSLLKQAFDHVSKLSEQDQDAVAAIVLDELASEQRWSDSFAASQENLAKLAQQALSEYNAGRTKQL
jgi:hypothetical protein